LAESWSDVTERQDLEALPDDLPVPVDDGAADHLVGRAIPHLSFPSTRAGVEMDIADLSQTGLVLYLYPRTGRPGEPLPRGWDQTPGARGCTPQSCAFRDRFGDFAHYGTSVAGLSAQTPEDQREASSRLKLPFPLLADPRLRLADALDLPTFTIAGMTLYRRLTLVARAGRITRVFYPVFPPHENAAEVLSWLARQDLREGSLSSTIRRVRGGPAPPGLA
jgi:peroxiredoxin